MVGGGIHGTREATADYYTAGAGLRLVTRPGGPGLRAPVSGPPAPLLRELTSYPALNLRS